MKTMLWLVCLALSGYWIIAKESETTIPSVINESSSDTIYWSKTYLLTWDDFQGPVDTASWGVAATHSGLISNAALSPDNEVQITVKALFLRHTSWVKAEGRTPHVLNHERRHFDITEIYARKANAAFKKYRFSRKNFSSEVSKIFNSFVEESNSIQKQYDLETDHSMNEEKQKEWDKKIDKWLEESE